MAGGKRLSRLVGPGRRGPHGDPVLGGGRPGRPARHHRAGHRARPGRLRRGPATLERLAALESQDFELALGDLGTYPAFVLPNAFSFDHYTHIRADLFAPRGPLTDQPPPSDELRLTPALDWIEAALPQQNAGPFGSLTGTIEIAVCGPGARTIRLGSGEPMAHISSDAPSFVRWVTQRATWPELGVRASGDERQLSVARTLRVF